MDTYSSPLYSARKRLLVDRVKLLRTLTTQTIQVRSYVNP